MVDLGTAPTRTLTDDWKKLDQKAKRTIRLCLSDSVLSNVAEEATTKELWDKLRNLYQFKSLVNKLFLRKKFYNLRMRDGG
jgi:putative heme degradation protein